MPAWRHGVMVGLPSTQWTDWLAFPGVITPGEGVDAKAALPTISPSCSGSLRFAHCQHRSTRPAMARCARTSASAAVD